MECAQECGESPGGESSFIFNLCHLCHVSLVSLVSCVLCLVSCILYLVLSFVCCCLLSVVSYIVSCVMSHNTQLQSKVHPKTETQISVIYDTFSFPPQLKNKLLKLLITKFSLTTHSCTTTQIPS